MSKLSKCCRKFDRKNKVCKSCPFVVGLNKKQRRSWARTRRKVA